MKSLSVPLWQQQADDHAAIAQAAFGGVVVADRLAGVASFDRNAGRIDAVGEWFARFIELDRERAQLQSEVFTVALRDRRLRAKLVERLRRPRSLLGAFIEAQCRELGIELPVPREQAATLVLALAGGLAQQKLVDPDSVPEELFPLALTLLVRGLAA